jgi:hypothetical protein
MDVDEGCADVSEKLTNDCFRFVTECTFNDRITTSQLQAKLKCSSAQSELLIANMLNAGMLKRVQCSRMKTRVYKYAHASNQLRTPLAPPSSRQSSMASVDDPVYACTPKKFPGKAHAHFSLNVMLETCKETCIVRVRRNT